MSTTVSCVLRLFVAIVTVAALVGPNLATLCAMGGAGHCEQAAHTCCDVPRLTACDCADVPGAFRAEAAQRPTTICADCRLVAIAGQPLTVPDVSSPTRQFSPPPPPLPPRERLSLLAILVI